MAGIRVYNQITEMKKYDNIKKDLILFLNGITKESCAKVLSYGIIYYIHKSGYSINEIAYDTKIKELTLITMLEKFESVSTVWQSKEFKVKRYLNEKINSGIVYTKTDSTDLN